MASKTSFYNNSGITNTQINAIDTAVTNAASSATAAALSQSNAAASSASASSSEITVEQHKDDSLASSLASASSASTASTKASEAAASAVASEVSRVASASSASSILGAVTNSANSATAAATSATDADTAKTAAETALDEFTDLYLGSKSSSPAVDNDNNALIVGSMYFDTTGNLMKVYNGTLWVNAGSSVNGTVERQSYTATAGQTTFNVTYDVGFVDLWLNGIKLLVGTDFTATNGTSIVLTIGASVDDVVDIIAFGTFELADHYTRTASDARYVNVAGDTMTGDLTVGGIIKTTGGTDIDMDSSASGQLKLDGDGYGGAIALNAQGMNIYTNSASRDIIFGTNETEVMRIDGAGSVGIGTNSPNAKMHLQVSGDDSNLAEVSRFETTNSGETSLRVLVGQSNVDATLRRVAIDAYRADSNVTPIAFTQTTSAGTTEATRINSNGDLMHGNSTTPYTLYTANNTATKSGVGLRSEGYIAASRMDDFAMQLNRMGTDGEILGFRKNGTQIGGIGVNSNRIYFGGTGTGLAMDNGAVKVLPWNPSTNAGRDNQIDLGSTSFRFDDIYATNSNIVTSDFNEKQDIASLTATEMLVGKRISTLFKTFRWKDSVAERGDNARTHTGVIAQDVQAAFTAEGLDAGDYALFISSTWWETQTDVDAVDAVEAVAEVTDEDGNVTTEAVEAVEAVDAYTRTDTYDTEDEAPEGATERTRLGIRYPELLAFVGAYNEQRFATLEVNQTAIEARLTALEAV